MRRRPLLLAVLVAIVGNTSVVHAFTNPANFWCKRFGSTGNDQAASVAVDASGNIYVTGTFEGSVSFGGATFVSVGGTDIFLAKFSPSGAHIWSKAFGSTALDSGRSVAVDPSGNVLITGAFNGTISFGGSTFTNSFADVFVAKFFSNGAHMFSQKYGGTNHDEGRSITTDASGNILVAGTYRATASFGGATFTNTTGIVDIFIAKYNSSLVHQWSHGFGGPSDDIPSGVATDAAGNVFMAGYFFTSISVGGATFVSAGSNDIFLAKYNASGVHQWSQSFGNSSQNETRGIAVNAAGTFVAITGFFTGASISMGGGSTLFNGGSSDALVACYNGSGTYLWSRNFGGTALDNSLAIAVDASSNVFLAGYTQSSTFYFGGDVFANRGAGDIALVKLNAVGDHKWSGSYGGVADDNTVALACDGLKSVVAAGYFDAVVDFGAGEVASAGGQEIFVAKYGATVGDPDITSVADVGNDQGRKVKVRFNRSGGDDAGATMNPVTDYVVLRRDDPPPAVSSAPGAMLDAGWTEVGSVRAFGANAYGIDVPTIGDSTVALGQYYSVFRVRAATPRPSVFFNSEPDSGWSLDNLAPGVPLNLVFESGDLVWEESPADDFDFFTVYGSNTDSFASATLVNYSVAPALDVTGMPYVFYFVTATDFAGNEGKPARVNTLSGTGGTPKSYVLSVSNHPNPFNPRTTVNYTIPSRGFVTVNVFDARGSRVRILFQGERDAGAFRVEWDGRADNGATVGSGVYFARIEHNGATRSKKMLLLK